MTQKRIYAIGDIHGCNRELELMLDTILCEIDLARDQLVFIGDYIDRGPDSCKVIENLCNVVEELPQTIFLRGNHEDMMLGFLGYGARSEFDRKAWLYNGGHHMLNSYGIPDASPQEIVQTLKEKYPHHLDFFHNLKMYHETDDYIFVHAGLFPQTGTIDEQYEHDLLWMREPFLQTEYDFGKKVIHGHTIVPDVTFDRYKINIDTGCFHPRKEGGKLSCIVLPEERVITIEKES